MRSPRRPSMAFAPKIRFAPDSPLEGSGFEPSVPLPRLSSIRAVRAEITGQSTDVFRRDREFDVTALQGRLSTSSQIQCSTDPGLIAGTWHRPLFLTRDRWFESISLQRRVRCEPISPAGGAERQKKTSWPVRFELTEQTRQVVPIVGGTASGLDRRSKPFFLFPELWGHGFKIPYARLKPRLGCVRSPGISPPSPMQPLPSSPAARL